MSNFSIGSFKNKLINGDFRIWQRGTSFTTTGGYTSDRYLHLSAGGSRTITREAFTPGQTDVPGNPEFFLKNNFVGGLASNENEQIQYRIEDVRTFSGEQATLSFWARADIGTISISTEFFQCFGTGGSSAVSSIEITTHALTTTWKKFFVNVNIPSIVGKTLGINWDDYLLINFWFSEGGTFSARSGSLGAQSGVVSLSQVQLEAGPVATEFEYRPLSEELILAQRYFQRFGQIDAGAIDAIVANGHYSSPGNPAFIHLPYYREMRAIPSIAIVNPTTLKLIIGATSTLATSISASLVTNKHCFLAVNTSSTISFLGTMLGIGPGVGEGILAEAEL